jgi:phenol hydroxylase P2 protein
VSTKVSRSLVGIELMEGEECDAIIDAIMEERPETVVTRWSSIIRLDVPDRVVVRQAMVEEHLGREWDTRDLNQVVSAYHGYFTQWDADLVLLSWDPDDREVSKDV